MYFWERIAGITKVPHDLATLSRWKQPIGCTMVLADTTLAQIRFSKRIFTSNRYSVLALLCSSRTARAEAHSWELGEWENCRLNKNGADRTTENWLETVLGGRFQRRSEAAAPEGPTAKVGWSYIPQGWALLKMRRADEMLRDRPVALTQDGTRSQCSAAFNRTHIVTPILTQSH